jgi:hypothetical protein
MIHGEILIQIVIRLQRRAIFFFARQISEFIAEKAGKQLWFRGILVLFSQTQQELI